MLHLRILIVEDNEKLANNYKRSLEKQGEIIIVDRFTEVLTQIICFEPQLIILDIGLANERDLDPNRAGIQILEKIRNLKFPLCNTPVIIITGRVEPEIEEQCRALGAEYFFNKPISNEILRQAVNKVMSMRKIKVFISYSHINRDVAHKLKYALRSYNIDVIIDVESMQPGSYIQEFIAESIKISDVTLSIISNNSLNSAWVAMETVESFHQKKLSNKKIIACYLDDEFLKPDYGLRLAEKIDIRLNEICKLIIQFEKEKLDAKHLDNEKTRLFHLRNNITEILTYLRETLCIDIREDKFESNLCSIITSIKKMKP